MPDNHPITHLTTEQLDRELGYRLGLFISHELHEQGALSSVELRRFEQYLAQKFSPLWGAYLRQISQETLAIYQESSKHGHRKEAFNPYGKPE